MPTESREVSKSNLLSRARALADKLPLFRAFVRARVEDYSGAYYEFMVVWVASVVPIGLSVVIDYIIGGSIKSGAVSATTTGWSGIYQRIVLNLNSGEVFIYIISFLGTAALVLYRYNKMGRRFPDYWTIVGIGGSMVLLSAVIFGLQRSHAVARQDLVDRYAVVMYVATLILFFVSLLYEQMRTKPYGKELRSGETALMQEMEGYKPV
jgi:hypothetical protein